MSDATAIPPPQFGASQDEKAVVLTARCQWATGRWECSGNDLATHFAKHALEFFTKQSKKLYEDPLYEVNDGIRDHIRLQIARDVVGTSDGLSRCAWRFDCGQWLEGTLKNVQCSSAAFVTKYKWHILGREHADEHCITVRLDPASTDVTEDDTAGDEELENSGLTARGTAVRTGQRLEFIRDNEPQPSSSEAASATSVPPTFWWRDRPLGSRRRRP